MALFYNQADQDIYNSGTYFIPQEKYRLNSNFPVIKEEDIDSDGITNTNSFIDFANTNNQNNDRVANVFDPYTARTLSMGPFEPGHYTYRTDYNRTGYLPGMEPQETYLDKMGNLVKMGIGTIVPGGNFLMGMADNFSRENRLNAADNAFIDQQLGITEQSMYEGSNLSGQDRYGFNKESFTGNYADKVKERAQIARDRKNANKDLRDIDKYYLEKEKELDDIEEQIAFNNAIRQRDVADKIRAGAFKNPDGTDIYSGTNIHPGTPPSSGSGDGYTGSGDFANIDNTGKDYGPYSKGSGSTQSTSGNYEGSKGRAANAFRMAKGGLASIL
tara:strand:- start:18 stop:1007 length:990 start_codon:yes stop_codon:yes gene_type:complete